ncbi:MAG: LPS-assembly protein LptD [Halieaceae bacterium]|nr:LPS-assembly protein LptD [Halieaceae bacterium]
MHYHSGPTATPACLLPLTFTPARLLPNPLGASVLLASWSLLAQPLWATELVEVGVIPLTDWQPLAIVPKAEADLRCRQCSGKFIDPLASVNIDVPPTEADLEVSADDSEVTEGTLFFSGNVRVQQGYRFVTADEVQIDRQNETAVASGQVTLREPGIVLTGAKIRYDSISERADLTDAQYVLHTRQLSGTAQELTRQANGDIDITEGAMTFCAPDDPSWVLQASEITIDPDRGEGQAWGAKLRVAGVPVFYLPWVRFPVDSRRKTGLLFPDLGSDSRGGIDMTQPIYFNLAPNYDALYRPRHIEERGLLHQAQGRWLSESIGYWEASGGWIGDDSKYQDDNPNIDSDRWLIHTEHKGQFGAAWRTKINFNRVSDPEYVKDIENNRLSAQRQTALQQLGRVDWLGETWQVRVDVEQFQSLADDIRNDYQKMPQITASYRGGQEWLGVEPIFTTQLSHFESDSVRVTGHRLYTEAGLTMPQRWVSGFFTPTVKYRSVSYELDDFPLLDETSPDAGAMMASLDGGLIFERQTTLGGTSMTQTLEPRAYYLYSEYEQQTGHPDFDSAELTFSYNQLYRDTRFSGHDRIDDANQLSLGVTTRFINNKTGNETLSASVGQIYYLRDREVRLNPFDPDLGEHTSAIAAELVWSPSSKWQLRSSLLYDTNQNTFDAAYAQASFKPAAHTIFNVGYTLREPPPSLVDRPVTEQANASLYFPINDTWSVFGAYEYSLEASEVVESMAGFEYDDCCWRVRLLYMRYVDTLVGDIVDFNDPNLERESSFQIQVVLKGMGGFGARVDELLSDMIRGFQKR